LSITNKIVVCERCGFIAMLSETVGWAMSTTQKGLCPAGVKDAEHIVAKLQSKAATSTARR
jgi:hypothetical protein